MVKAASNEKLAAGFEEHLAQTKEHAARLENLLASHEQTTRGPKCRGMGGVLEEGAGMVEEEADEEVRDAGLIAAAQRVEHYEMAGLGIIAAPPTETRHLASQATEEDGRCSPVQNGEHLRKSS